MDDTASDQELKLSKEDYDDVLYSEYYGYFKMALTACAANFFAINHEFNPEQIADKAERQAEFLWERIIKRRREKNAK